MAVAALSQTRTDRESPREKLRQLIRAKSVRRGHFELASGGMSDILFDMKNTTQDQEGMHLVAQLITEELKGETAAHLGGLELGAIPVVMATCMASRRSALVVRKAPKGRGTNRLIEGDLPPHGGEVIVVDDVTTKGGSVMKAVNAFRAGGCEVRKVITVVDRHEGARELLAESGIELVALFDRDDIE